MDVSAAVPPAEEVVGLADALVGALIVVAGLLQARKVFPALTNQWVVQVGGRALYKQQHHEELPHGPTSCEKSALSLTATYP